MKKLTSQDQLTKFVADNNVALVKFSAEWCAPCKMMTPLLKDIEKDYPDIAFADIDVEEAEGVSKSMNISAVPILISYKNGKEVARHVGYAAKKALEVFVNGLNKDGAK